MSGTDYLDPARQIIIKPSRYFVIFPSALSPDVSQWWLDSRGMREIVKHLTFLCPQLSSAHWFHIKTIKYPGDPGRADLWAPGLEREIPGGCWSSPRCKRGDQERSEEDVPWDWETNRNDVFFASTTERSVQFSVYRVLSYCYRLEQSYVNNIFLVSCLTYETFLYRNTLDWQLTVSNSL